MTRRRITSDFVAGRPMPLLLLFLLATAAADSATPRNTDDDNYSDDNYVDSVESYAYDSPDDNFGNRINYTTYYRGRGSDVYGKFSEYYDNNNNNNRRGGRNFYGRSNNYYGNNNNFPSGSMNYPGGGNNYPGAGNNYPGAGNNYRGGHDYNHQANRSPGYGRNEVDGNRIPGYRKPINQYSATRAPVYKKPVNQVNDNKNQVNDNKNQVKDNNNQVDDDGDNNNQVNAKKSSTHSKDERIDYTDIPPNSTTINRGKPRIDSKETGMDLINDVAARRQIFAISVARHPFNANRTRILSKMRDIPKWTEGIIYWMYRDHRVQDNWALLKAQQLALSQKVSLHVVYCRPNKVFDGSIRQYKFMFEGLKKVQDECKNLNIQFHFVTGRPTDIFPDFVKNHNIGAIVLDFMPLKEHNFWTKHLVYGLGSFVPIIQVDAHNVVPCWSAAERQIHSTRAMRVQIEEVLEKHLTEFPPVVNHLYSSRIKAKPINWEEADKGLEVDRNVTLITSIEPGYEAGMRELESFIRRRLPNYDLDRVNPLVNGLSNLSPWMHFGHISAQRVILECEKYAESFPQSVSAFREEILIRRELADNFCYYNSRYDKYGGGPSWGRSTLNDHRNDTRPHLYTRQEFEYGRTHNDLWNAAQIQMVREGKMHRFLRAYWSKKVLEWTATPETAVDYVNYFNNKYSLDGSDPSGYVGCLWSLVGLHDHQWVEREIFGTIRFLNYYRCHIMFDTKKFIEKYVDKKYRHKND